MPIFCFFTLFPLRRSTIARLGYERTIGVSGCNCTIADYMRMSVNGDDLDIYAMQKDNPMNCDV